MIDGEQSVLPVINFDSKTTWHHLRKLCAPDLDSDGWKRLHSALKSTVNAVAVERHYIDKDYRDTFSHFHSKKFTTPNSRCTRLHFFLEKVKRAEMRDGAKLQTAYIGYSVIRPTKPNSIGRTLLDPRRLDYPRGHLCLCQEKVSIQGVPLLVEGFPFISQDADVTVCAQSALWMLLRYFSNKYPVYNEVYPFQIAQLVKDFSIGRIVPSGGLTDWQMSEATRRLGFGPLIYSRSNYKKFDHLLYTYVESGIPVLVSVPGHVVVAFGHQSDYQKKLPGTRVTFSSHFNTAFVINDDNKVPYQILSQQRTGSPVESKYTFREIEAFTAPLPEKVFLPAEEFQVLVTRLLNRKDFGYKRVSRRLAKDRLILRLFLTTVRSFKERLDERGMGHRLVREIYANLPLPHFIWVCELSTPKSFANHNILGEVIWDATRNGHEPNGWIALHYPERLIVDVGSAFNLHPMLQEFDLQKSDEYRLYRSNLKDA